MCNSQINLIMFLLLVKYSCGHLPLQSINTNTSELKFKSLETCLILAGVKDKNIIPRNNGHKYAEWNYQWNTLNGYVKPMAYLVADDVFDIQTAVLCCKLLKIRLVVRSGGHSYLKTSYGDSNSLVIDLQRLNKITSNPKGMNCDIGSGALVGVISYTLWKEGNYVVPVGICPTVGVGGLTLGGGYGYFSREFGLSSDNLIELEMVDAKGQLLVINNHTNTDLFWALRGGGGGSFGIVTNFKFQMYHGPKSIVYGRYYYNIDSFALFYNAWQSLVTSDLPNKIGTQIEIVKDTITMEIFSFNFQNIDNATLSSMDIEKLLHSFSFPKHTERLISVQSYDEFLSVTSQYYSQEGQYVGWKKVKSMFVYKVLNRAEISKLQTLLSPYLEWSKLYIVHDGGAIDYFSRSETAFIHRNNLCNIQLQAFTADSEEANLSADSAMNIFYEKSKEVFNHRESYQNFLDQDIGDFLERYYAENLKKLIQTKMRIDPENVFHHPQSIPTIN